MSCPPAISMQMLPLKGSGQHLGLDEFPYTRGCHSHNACTTICDRGQNALTDLDRKFYHCIALV